MSAARNAKARATTRVARATLVATIAVAGVACGSDDNDAETSTTSTPISAPESTVPPGTVHAHDDTVPSAETVEEGVIEIEAVDYAFENLPESVPAGTRLALVNTANAELHELVAIRLADDETRTVDELMHLPDAELGAIIGAGPPAAVLLAAPGAEQVAAVGDGTLTQPGRYIVFCSIPSGVAPQVYLDAAAASGGGPPQVNGGPPHFVHGMFAELTVE